jgi:hypothetical protein
MHNALKNSGFSQDSSSLKELFKCEFKFKKFNSIQFKKPTTTTAPQRKQDKIGVIHITKGNKTNRKTRKGNKIKTPQKEIKSKQGVSRHAKADVGSPRITIYMPH